MIRNLLLFCCIIIFFSDCTTQKIVTQWKADRQLLAEHKIMVVGIIKDHSDSLRMEIEDDVVKYLTELGYTAVSALGEFGSKGFSDLTQEETYLKICNKNIDFVMTVALIDKLKQIQVSPRKYSVSHSYYYYNSIWNYKKMQADLSIKEFPSNTRYIWEVILFDLNRLEPLCVVQTMSFSPGNEHNGDYIQKLLRKMKKEKILYRQKTRMLKPF